MVGLIVALARGLWNRAVGLLASGSASPDRLQEIAISQPTSVSITEDESLTLLNLATRAMESGQRWWNDLPMQPDDIPQVPWTQFPSINGGEPGEFNHGVVVTDPETGKQGDPVFWSDDEPSDVDKVIDNLFEYIAQGEGRDTVPFYQELLEKLERRDKKAIVPLWLYRYISPDNWKRA